MPSNVISSKYVISGFINYAKHFAKVYLMSNDGICRIKSPEVSLSIDPGKLISEYFILDEKMIEHIVTDMSTAQSIT